MLGHTKKQMAIRNKKQKLQLSFLFLCLCIFYVFFRWVDLVGGVVGMDGWQGDDGKYCNG